MRLERDESGRVARLTAGLTAAIAGAWLMGPGESAAAGRVYVLQQATNLTQGSVWEPQIRQGRGEFVTFVSDGDVMGPGTAHIGKREVYLWSSETGSLQRVTTTPGGGESYEASRLTDDFHTQNPSVLAFVSTGNLDPSVGNADGNPEIFLWLLETGEFRQLTDTLAPVVNSAPYPSDTGECLLFQSTGDLDNNDGSVMGSAPSGFTNADGSPEVFYIDFHDKDLVDYHFTQVSDGPPGSTSSSASVGGYFFTNQCANMVFQSDYDQLGNGSTGSNVYDFRRPSAQSDQLSLPGTGGLNIEPRMSGAGVTSGGPSAVFASNADLRDNGSTGFHIYKFAVMSGLLRQVTGDPGGGHRRPVVSDGSAVIAFESTGEAADPSRKAKRGPNPPYNADGNSEIIRVVGKHLVNPITRSTGCSNDHASIMGNGRGIGFRSDCDLITGHNMSGQDQVFVYYEARRGDPLYTAADCSIAEGCCSTANGCYEEVAARAYRIR